MSELNKTVARLLVEQRAPLAEAVTARQYEAQPGLLAKYGAAGRAKCLQDAGYHLSYLADSVAAESPSLFSDYVGWAKVMLGARGIPAGDLSRNLYIMREVVRQRCPPNLWGVVDEFFEEGLKRLPSLPTDLPTLFADSAPHAGLARQYLRLLLGGERHAAGRLLRVGVPREPQPRRPRAGVRHAAECHDPRPRRAGSSTNSDGGAAYTATAG